MADETRQVPFEITRAEPDGDGLTLEGYASVFDSPTEIDSAREGHFIERIKPGAFKKTLSERTPVLMFNHGQHPLIGDMPIGSITHAREDSRGLFVRARLASNWLIEPVREAIAQRSVTGMSFRFSVPKGKDTWRNSSTRGGLRERDINEARVSELGPVVFPAYPDTTVGVRSQDLIDVLDDTEARTELARALFALRTDTSDEAAREGTSDEAVVDSQPPAVVSDEPPPGHSDNTRKQAALMAAARLKGIIDG